MLIIPSATDMIEKIRAGELDAIPKLSSGLLKTSEIPTLLRHLSDKDEYVRSSVTAALGNFHAQDFIGTDAVLFIVEALNTACEREMHPLIFILGRISTQEAIESLCRIITSQTSGKFSVIVALDSLKNTGAHAYTKVDLLRDFARAQSDKEVIDDTKKCLSFICDEVRDLYTKTLEKNFSQESFFNPQRGKVFIQGNQGLPHGALHVIFDGKISHSINSFPSSCRLILIHHDRTCHCIFSQDEFSFGTSVTNSAGFLIPAVKNHFKLDEASTLFIQAQLRGHHDFNPNNELTIMVPPSEGELFVRTWVPPGLMNQDVEKLLRPYLDESPPLPHGFDLNEALKNYTPNLMRY